MRSGVDVFLASVFLHSAAAAAPTSTDAAASVNRPEPQLPQRRVQPLLRRRARVASSSPGIPRSRRRHRRRRDRGPPGGERVPVHLLLVGAEPRPEPARGPLRGRLELVPLLSRLGREVPLHGDRLQERLAERERDGARRGPPERDLVGVLELVRLERLDPEAVDGRAVGRAQVAEDPRAAEGLRAEEVRGRGGRGEEEEGGALVAPALPPRAARAARPPPPPPAEEEEAAPPAVCPLCPSPGTATHSISACLELTESSLRHRPRRPFLTRPTTNLRVAPSATKTRGGSEEPGMEQASSRRAGRAEAAGVGEGCGAAVECASTSRGLRLGRLFLRRLDGGSRGGGFLALL